ncbi:hypothetical protein V5O48_003991, partial [Marasmius crinis-equi]
MTTRSNLSIEELCQQLLELLPIEIDDEEAEFSSVVHPSSPINAFSGSDDDDPREFSAFMGEHSDLPEVSSDADPSFTVDEESENEERRPRDSRRLPTDDEQKTLSVLSFIQAAFPAHFTFVKFLRLIFTSNHPAIRKSCGYLFSPNNFDIFRAYHRLFSDKENVLMNAWVVKEAAGICGEEIDSITKGSYHSAPALRDIANRLRVPSKQVDLKMVQRSRIVSLQQDYAFALKHLQTFLRKVVDSDNEAREGIENSLLMSTSILLNARSQKTNYHQVINGLMLWDNRVPKRVVQALNQYGVCSSHPHLVRASRNLSSDITHCARLACLDELKLKILIYDNYNWRKLAYEASYVHGTVSYDQVSGILVCVAPKDVGSSVSATELSDVSRFDALEGQRTKINPRRSLEDILPSSEDQQRFLHHSTIHIATILGEEVACFKDFHYGDFTEPRPIPAHCTELYCLPPLDQEQSSTRGNIAVLHDYFLNVLRAPLEVFERVMFFVLGDRLTVVRDRAAQDLRALDQSPWRFHKFQSFKTLNGLMHECMNMIQTMGKNAWGKKSDELSLSSILDLPCFQNRRELSLKKLDYYAWLRFLDVVGRSLVIAGAAAALGLESVDEFGRYGFSQQSFDELCNAVAYNFVVAAPDALEADGTKPVLGDTVCRNALLLNHDLMTLREMRHAIKHGHPTRIHGMLKYWAPMFYAGEGYNYAQETMELLHNLQHDWPDSSANVLLPSMLCNRQGRSDSFLEGDLVNEHYNDRIKEHAHGTNASPLTLSRHSPTAGHLQDLSDHLFEDLGVEDLGVEALNQKHHHVEQHQDVAELTKYFITKL